MRRSGRSGSLHWRVHNRPGRLPADKNHPARPRPLCADGRTTRERNRFAIVANRIRLVSVLSGDTKKRRKISC